MSRLLKIRVNREDITAGAASTCVFFSALMLLLHGFHDYFTGFNYLGLPSGFYIYYILFFTFSLLMIPISHRYWLRVISKGARGSIKAARFQFAGTLLLGFGIFYAAMFIHREALVDKVVIQDVSVFEIDPSALEAAVGFDLAWSTGGAGFEFIFKKGEGRKQKLIQELKARGYLLH